VRPFADAVHFLTMLALVVALPIRGASAAGDDDLLDDLETPAAEAAKDAPSADTTEEPVEEETPAAAEEVKASTPEAAPAAAVAAPAPKKKIERVEPSALDRVKAVPKKPVLKRGRLELSLFPSTTLNDAYFHHYAGSGALIYYPHDSFGIGIGGDYLIANVKSSNTDVIRQAMTAVPAVFDSPRFFAHLDMYWVPIYGKVSLLGSDIVHFELYGSAGLGMVSVPGGRTPWEVNAGLGERILLADWLALRFEVRDHLFVDTQEVNGVARSDVQSYLMFLAGVSFFIPPSFEYRIR